MKYPNNYIIAIILFACFLVSLLTLQEHIIYYQEQHHLFLYTSEYFRDTIHWKGFPEYISAFLVQFYYYPWLGATIVSLMLASIYLMVESLIRHFTGKRDLFQIGAIVSVALYFTLDNTDESPFWVFLAFVVCGIIWVASIPVRNRKKRIPKEFKGKLLLNVLPFVSVLVYLGAAFLIEMSIYNRDERSMLLAERAVKNQDWDKTIEITSQYLSTGKNNRLMHYLRHLALAHKGILLDHLFDYPQKLGSKTLSFPWTRNSRETEHGNLVHEATGDINAAHFWTFECMTVWGETSTNLSKLGHYNAVLGRPEVAKKFADKLDKSLFYKKEADKIRQEAENGGAGSGLYYARPDSVTVTWFNIADFRPNLLQNFNADPTNPIVRQYLIAAMLLSNSMQELVGVLTPQDLKSKAVREALVLYNADSNSAAASHLSADLHLQPEFARFKSLMLTGDTRALTRQFGPTFWYYRYFLFDPKNP